MEPTIAEIVAEAAAGEPAEFTNWHIHHSFSLPLRRLSREGGGLPKGCPKVFVSRMGRRAVIPLFKIFVILCCPPIIVVCNFPAVSDSFR